MNFRANSSTRSRPAAMSSGRLMMRRSIGTPIPSQQKPVGSTKSLNDTPKPQPFGNRSPYTSAKTPEVKSPISVACGSTRMARAKFSAALIPQRFVSTTSVWVNCTGPCGST